MHSFKSGEGFTILLKSQFLDKYVLNIHPQYKVWTNILNYHLTERDYRDKYLSATITHDHKYKTIVFENDVSGIVEWSLKLFFRFYIFRTPPGCSEMCIYLVLRFCSNIFILIIDNGFLELNKTWSQRNVCDTCILGFELNLMISWLEARDW